jgi:hypothetical protein
VPVLETKAADPVETVRVQLIKFAQRLAMSPEYIQDLKVDVFADAFTGNVITTFCRKIPAVCGPDVQVPLSWWDHFKERFFRGYLRNRFPVRYRFFQARMYLPELPIPTYEGPRILSFPEVSRDLRTFQERMRDARREERL